MKLDIATIEKDSNYNISGLMLSSENPISYTFNTNFNSIKELIDNITKLGNLSLDKIDDVMRKINAMTKMENMAIDETGVYTSKLYSDASDIALALSGSLVLDHRIDDMDSIQAKYFLNQYISLLYMNLYKLNMYGYDSKEKSDAAIKEYMKDNHDIFFAYESNVMSQMFSMISTRFKNVASGVKDSIFGLSDKSSVDMARRPEKVKIRLYETDDKENYTLNCNTFDNKYFSTVNKDTVFGIETSNLHNINNMIFLINSCDISYPYDGHDERVIDGHIYYLPKKIDFTINLVSERVYTLNEAETLYFDKQNNLDKLAKYLGR